LEVEDDGVGISPERATVTVDGIAREGMGIGMRNVRERMQVLYEGSAEVEVVSRPGRGTRIRLLLPVLRRHDVEQRRVKIPQAANADPQIQGNDLPLLE
jgi:two-component system LytT family sensor kinase